MTNFLQEQYDKAIKLEKIHDPRNTFSPNPYFCPQSKVNFMYTSAHLPVFSSVMSIFFHCTNKGASSARIEAYFKNLIHTHGLKNFTNPNKSTP